MTRLENRVVRLERHGHGNWRAYAHLSADQVPDSALLGFLGDVMNWPPGHIPTDDELLAIASREHPSDDEGGP
jgi:hypothetical protein